VSGAAIAAGTWLPAGNEQRSSNAAAIAARMEAFIGMSIPRRSGRRMRPRQYTASSSALLNDRKTM
jgi:hypothetical protein